MTPQLINACDTYVERGRDGNATLYSAEGELLFVFPPAWTDEQIMRALAFANRGYAHGHAAGINEARCAVRRALGIVA